MKAAHLLLGMVLAAPLAPLAAQPIAASERPLGPGRAFTGVYATNFEIGYFVECDPTGGGCAGWRDQEPRWLTGSAWMLEKSLMECIAKWNGSRDRWALYAISFRSRETLDRRPKRFLHDTERRVLLDDLVALELIGTDATLDLLLPQYRRQPSLGC